LYSSFYQSFFCRSPDDPESTPGFLREGFGRQSMSEKRKCHIDPKNLDVYQKIKGGKDKTPHNYGEVLKCAMSYYILN
jgi:hypothetical protein